MRRIAASQRDGVIVDLKLEFGGETHETQEAQGIVQEGLIRHRAQHARLDVVKRTRHRHHLAITEAHRDRVDGQIAAQEIGRDAIRRAGHVDLVLVSHDAPGTVALGQRKDWCADGGGVRARRGLGVARGDEIPIGQWATEQDIADRAADKPDVVAREGSANRCNGPSEAWIRLVGHPTTSRSPRSTVARTPQMISYGTVPTWRAISSAETRLVPSLPSSTTSSPSTTSRSSGRITPN